MPESPSGRLASNAADHGPTCADTPIDHSCGDTEADQGVTWREASANRSARLKAICDLHCQQKAGNGSTGALTGYCAACTDEPWPCPTYHEAAGWNRDEDEAHWCPHAGTRL